ncbi:MAG: chloride channel protein, partial [Gaiellaceae bacterium]
MESRSDDPRRYLRLVLLGAAVGIPAALAAALFLAVVHPVQHWRWTDLPDALGDSAPQWYLVVGLPVAGAAIVLAARTLLPGDGGHPPLEGLSPKPTPLAHGPGIVLAAIGTLGFGAVLGPEAPVIALGTLVALAITASARLAEKESRVLATAGAFAAISALFGGPIVGGVLMVEAGVGLGAAVIPALLPGFVAAAVGYVVFVGFGDWGRSRRAGPRRPRPRSVRRDACPRPPPRARGRRCGRARDHGRQATRGALRSGRRVGSARPRSSSAADSRWGSSRCSRTASGAIRRTSSSPDRPR